MSLAARGGSSSLLGDWVRILVVFAFVDLGGCWPEPADSPPDCPFDFTGEIDADPAWTCDAELEAVGRFVADVSALECENLMPLADESQVVSLAIANCVDAGHRDPSREEQACYAPAVQAVLDAATAISTAVTCCTSYVVPDCARH
jgi:hypothetical protein